MGRPAVQWTEAQREAIGARSHHMSHLAVMTDEELDKLRADNQKLFDRIFPDSAPYLCHSVCSSSSENVLKYPSCIR